MHITAETLDDILRKVLQKVLKSKTVVSSTRGSSLEVDGVILELRNPRARLSRTEQKGTVFSCIGEFLWYFTKDNKLDFIEYYIPNYKKESEEGKTIYGGYGPRFFGFRGNNQIENVVKLLKANPNTRRAVIQIYDANDIASYHVEIPCTCTIQFLLRNNKLHMITHMRSNDAFIGLPHDVFCFTMLQELMAVELGVGMGVYKHFVGSLHLYEDKVKGARKYLKEGWQEDFPMPPVSTGDPWGEIDEVIKIEKRIRVGDSINIDEVKLSSYWKDFVRILMIFKVLKKEVIDKRDLKEIVLIKNGLSSEIYETYIRKKIYSRNGLDVNAGQLDLNIS